MDVFMLKFPVSIFLESNIFISAKYDFSSTGIFSVLTKMQVEGKISLFISHIVEHEVKSHMREEVSSIVSAFRKAQNGTGQTSKNLLLESSLAHLYTKFDKEKLIAEFTSSFDSFIEESNIEILDSDCVDCNSIVEDYFNNIPPFENNAKKKFEFPDAIMAAQLKNKFDEENPLWVISNDKGFCACFDEERVFTTFNSVKDALDKISQEEANMYNTVKEYILSSAVKSKISERIKNSILDNEFTLDSIDCDSSGICDGYEYEEFNADDVQSLDYILSSIEEISEDSILLTITATGAISLECSYEDYDNAVWDSEDKTYIILNTINITEQHTATFDCSVKLTFEDDANFEIEYVNFELMLNSRSLTEKTVHPSKWDKWDEED